MHGDNMSYAKTFDEALNGLFSKSTPVQIAEKPVESKPNAQPQILDQVKAANEAFDNYLKYSGNKRFSDAGKELEKLQQALQTLSNQSGRK